MIIPLRNQSLYHPNEKFKRFNGGLVILKERSFGPEVKTNVSQTILLNNLSK